MPQYGYRQPRNAFLEFMQGMQMAQGQQQNQMQNALLQRKIAQEDQLREALQQYTPGGDSTAIMRANPRVGLEMEELNTRRQKTQLDAIKPALDYVYSMSSMVKEKPELYPQIRARAIGLAPATEPFWPQQYDEGAFSNFQKNYEKMKKLDLNPYQAEMIQQGREKIAIQREKLEKPKEYAPQWFETEDGMGAWVKPGQQPPPGAKPSGRYKDTDYSKFRKSLKDANPDLSEEDVRKKWSLRTEADIPKWAITEANKQLLRDMNFQAGINPETNKQFEPGEKENFLREKAQGIIQTREELRGGGKGSGNKPLSVDPIRASYNNAKARVDSMPEGPAKEAEKIKLETRRQQLGIQ